jgi:hypothetical protein
MGGVLLVLSILCWGGLFFRLYKQAPLLKLERSTLCFNALVFQFRFPARRHAQDTPGFPVQEVEEL